MIPRIFLLLLFSFWVFVSGCSEDDPPPTGVVEDDTIEVTVDPTIAAWLKASVIPFATANAGSGFDDLQPLKQVIGDARIVALGEATHGTREFFLMKHRLLEFLVKEMGFTCFAIEATWPESNLVNDYIHTGEGNPAALLAGLYFWTWNTQEVLDMILWMRENRVSFHGFDMQFPAMAIDNVESYVARVDPANLEIYLVLYQNFKAYANDPRSYTSLTPQQKYVVRDQLRQAYDMIVDRKDMYELRSSVKEYAYALQSARVVQQGEELYSQRNSSYIMRDMFMAENTEWILEQEGPQAKIVLWAHNYHVSVDPNNQATMGTHLRNTFGDDMIVLGFSFFKGSFNAVEYDPWTGYGGLKKHTVGIPPEESYSYHFRMADIPRMMLDLRTIDFDSTATDWIPGPRPFRGIGAVYNDDYALNYFYNAKLPQEFDVMIYFEQTNESVLLPFPTRLDGPAGANLNENFLGRESIPHDGP
ncbi:MAG: erythromycin esterase family protein [Candidatus Latescibacterota bacterium]|nr:MAG: erythromycin esterase family protein [Candidatus Latescibacterota bacterium]